MAIKYKKFKELMASIESDLYTFADQNMIDSSKYIKEARKVNSELGLKLLKEREAILEVKDYKADLPLDFNLLQLALACNISYVKVPSLRGTQTEVNTNVTVPTSSCSLTEGPCDNCLSVTQKIGERTYQYHTVNKLSLTKRSFSKCTDSCLNFRFKTPDQIDIEDDQANFSFREGKVYINYLCDMVDEEGNLLILDHPLVNDYYEYQIKKKFFEAMKLNKEGDFLQDYQMMVAELRQARTRAISFVNTLEFDEIQQSYEYNRRRFYNKYINYFTNDNQGYYQGGI